MCLTVVWMVVLWWLTDLPAEHLPVVRAHPVLAGFGHVVAFGLLAVLLFLAGDGSLPQRCAWSVGLTVVYGILTEVNQALGTSGRDGDPWDAVANAVGGVMFTSALVWVRRGSARAFWLALATVPAALVVAVM